MAGKVKSLFIFHFFKKNSMRKFWFSVFSVWKSLEVLQKAHVKIVAHAIYRVYILCIHTLSSYFGK